MNREWLAPLTGVLFVALAIVAGIVAGEPPSAESPVEEIVDHYTDNKDSIVVGSFIGGTAAVSLVFFGGYMRKVLRAAEGEGGVLAAVALVGAAMMAIGLGIDITIGVAIAEAVDDVDPPAVQTLQALWDNDFVPIAIGIMTFLLATGISIVRHRALPAWLGWVAIALAIVGVTPIGWITFFGGAIWILIVSVTLAVRASSPVQQPR